LSIKYIALRKADNPKLKELLDKVFELNSVRDSNAEKKDNSIADKILSILPSSHKSYITKDKLSLLVRILVLNSVPVNDLNGIGLFPIVVLFDHSCKENCSMEAFGGRLVVTTIAHVSSGQPVTLNFLPKPYFPKQARLAQIKALYQSKCTCEMCFNEGFRDDTRSFVCRKCPYNGEDDCGVVCPKGLGEKVIDWVCHKCGDVPSNDVVQEFVKIEEETKDEDPIKLRVNDLLKGRVIHQHHYIIYRALELRVALLLKIRPTLCEKYINWILAGCAKVRTTPYNIYHPERAYYYDLLAQTRRTLENLKGCREAFLEASIIREKTSSKFSPTFALAKQKAVNPEKVEVNYWHPMKDM